MIRKDSLVGGSVNIWNENGGEEVSMMNGWGYSIECSLLDVV